MKCPACTDKDLVLVMSKNGVMIDICPKCKGIWLDKGEIFYFTEVPTYLKWKIDEALKSAKPSKRSNPHTNKPMVELPLLEGKLLIDYDPETGGIWLDEGELEKIPAAKELKIRLGVDKNTYPDTAQKKIRPVSLPNLGLVSGVTLFLLYGLITLILITLSNFGIITPVAALIIGIAFALIQFGLSPFFMDLSLNWFYKVRWTGYGDLPVYLKEFIITQSEKNNIKPPRIGIIPDGSPNAFTYGHTPNNARIVITAGIMELLEPEEMRAVVAHEMGHMIHWDMLVMTVAYLVPLILYYVYRTLMNMRTDRNDKFAPYRYAIAICSYILYIISEYIVLWFSRIREYFADRFAGEVTNEPDKLASALVKIGYGLAGRDKGKKEERRSELESVKAMGVFDPTMARALAVSSYSPASMGGEVDKENLKGAMRWDLWNPWALYYELQSTHPLIAKRLLALSRQCEVMGKEPYIQFDERRPESYWDEFLVDVLVASLPLLAIIIPVIMFFVHKNYFFLKFGLFLAGAGYLFATRFSYKFSYFPEMAIASVLKKVKVSRIRPVPCILKGRIIGRGIPGLIWSEDFVLQDESGIMFLDYKQPLGIWNFFFGLLRAKRYIGEEVEITGWYRRAPVPYTEIKNLKTKDGKVITCYAFNAKIFAGILIMFAGLYLMMFVK